MPVTQPWMEWDKVSDSTKRRYTKRTVEIVSSVLHTLSPNDPGSLWQAIVSSPAMNKALELDDLSKTARDYLQALTEAYNQAQDWDTRRQNVTRLSGILFRVVDGARAFEDLDNLVCQLGDLGLGKDWQVQHIELLKAAKSYIKGDFKVNLFVKVTLALQREVNYSMLNTMRCLSPIRKWKHIIATGLLPLYIPQDVYISRHIGTFLVVLYS